jgi:hemoglobin/transferrin/lactoferrin receptor protein
MLPLLLFLFAQDFELEETIITAPRAEATVTSTLARVTVVTGDELVATGARSLPRALAEATGVWMQETSMGGGAPVIRGLLGAHILVMIDGVRLNDSTTRLGPNQSLNTIDPAIVDRVDILRGNGSILYGSDAIGGVVAIWTKGRRAETQDPNEYLRPYQGSAEATYDTAIEGVRLSIEGSAAYGNHGGLGVASGFDFESYKAGENQSVDNTAYHGHSYFGSYEYAVGAQQTLRLTGTVSRDFNVPRTDKLNVGYGQTEPTHSDWRYSLQDRNGWVLSYTDEEPGEVADRMQVRVNLSTYTEERDRTKTGSSVSVHERDEVVSVGIGMDWQRALGTGHLFTWGLDASLDDVDSTREDTDGGVTTDQPGAFAPDANYSRFGVFVQDELFSYAPWYFTIGARFSGYDFQFGERNGFQSSSDQFSSLIGGIEAARDLGDGMLFTASLTQGFRAPNLDDLANDGSFASGTELANPDLEPEESLTLEGAIEVSRSNWNGSFGIFGTHIDDYIGRVLLDEGNPSKDGDEVYRRENTGEVQLYGADLGFWRRLGDELSAYSVDGSIAYVHGRQKDPSVGSGYFPARRVPPLNGHLALNYEPLEQEWFYLPNARAWILWADKQDRLNPQDVTDPRIDPKGTSSWLTYNFEVWGDFNPDATWRIALLNLTDELYRVHGSGVDALGRRLVIGLRLEF